MQTKILTLMILFIATTLYIDAKTCIHHKLTDEERRANYKLYKEYTKHSNKYPVKERNNHTSSKKSRLQEQIRRNRVNSQYRRSDCDRYRTRYE